MPLEVCTFSNMASQASGEPSLSKPPTKTRLRHSHRKLSQGPLERKTVKELYSRNGNAQEVHSTTLKADLGLLDDASTIDLPPGYSLGPKFLEDVFQDYIYATCWLSVFVLKPWSSSLTQVPSSGKHGHPGLSSGCSIFLKGTAGICCNCHGYERMVQTWNQGNVAIETVHRCAWEHVGNYSMVNDLRGLLQEMRRWSM